jgi:hypothetical protein
MELRERIGLLGGLANFDGATEETSGARAYEMLDERQEHVGACEI